MEIEENVKPYECYTPLFGSTETSKEILYYKYRETPYRIGKSLIIRRQPLWYNHTPGGVQACRMRRAVQTAAAELPGPQLM